MNQRKSRIAISKSDLEVATKQGVISVDQMKTLWDTLSVSSTVAQQPSRILQFIYYFGALLVISAMTWFMTLGWSWFCGGGLFLIAFCYGIAFFASGYLLWQKEGFAIPGGLLITMAVCVAPLAIFGLEKYSGIWPIGDPGDYTGYYMWIKGSWLFMEIGTILTGFFALRCVRFPFITAPIAISLWFLSMDVTPFLFGELDFTWQQQSWVSLSFGLGLLFFSYFIDRKSQKDFAFWGYLFGTLTFWGGLSLLAWTSELSWLIYFCVNMLLIMSSILLGRNVLMIFGVLGICDFLAHLAYVVFKSSVFFPFALSFIGIIIVCLGILYQKNSVVIKASIIDVTPKWMKKILPKNVN
jgi:hypothetical protein